MITLEEAVQLVWHAFEDMIGGEVYVKKIPSMNIMDIAEAISEKTKTNFIGIRPGEKLHEQMIGEEDCHYSYDYDAHYKILPAINDWYLDPERIKNGKKVPQDFSYNSKNNSEWMSVMQLRSWIKKKYGDI